MHAPYLHSATIFVIPYSFDFWISQNVPPQCLAIIASACSCFFLLMQSALRISEGYQDTAPDLCCFAKLGFWSEAGTGSVEESLDLKAALALERAFLIDEHERAHHHSITVLYVQRCADKVHRLPAQ